MNTKEYTAQQQELWQVIISSFPDHCHDQKSQGFQKSPYLQYVISHSGHPKKKECPTLWNIKYECATGLTYYLTESITFSQKGPVQFDVATA